MGAWSPGPYTEPTSYDVLCRSDYIHTSRVNEPLSNNAADHTGGRLNRRVWQRWLGFITIGLGILLVGFASAYLGLAQLARSGLEGLVYPVNRPIGGESASDDPKPIYEVSVGEISGSTYPNVLSVQIYPAAWIHPMYWGEPQWAGTESIPTTDIPPGFLPVSLDQVSALGANSPARRIEIPAIGVDAAVIELGILDLGDSKAYETPDNVVGHIPETANPGENSRGWYFGHLWSLVQGGGSVFRDLPKIPELLKHKPVDVIIKNDEGEFLYRVTHTSVVHRDDLKLVNSDLPSITLVTCVPILVYDHRVLVTAELLAKRN